MSYFIILLTFLNFACGEQKTVTTDQTPEWVSLARTESAEMYYSPKSLKRLSGSISRVQFKIELRKDTAEGRAAREHMTNQTTAALEGKAVKTVAYGIEVLEIECRIKRLREREQSLYADESELIEAVAGEDSPKWKEAVRGSAYDLVIERVCGLPK
jgi:predicted transcriptional regulator